MKVGLCNGCWDGLHPGHRFFLSKAREQCDWLVVAVNTDDSIRALKGSHRPLFPLQVRMRGLQAAGLAHAVVPFPGDPVALIKALQPAVLIRGHDQSDEGSQYVQALVRLPQLQGYSTTEIFNASH